MPVNSLIFKLPSSSATIRTGVIDSWVVSTPIEVIPFWVTYGMVTGFCTKGDVDLGLGVRARVATFAGSFMIE